MGVICGRSKCNQFYVPHAQHPRSWPEDFVELLDRTRRLRSLDLREPGVLTYLFLGDSFETAAPPLPASITASDPLPSCCFSSVCRYSILCACTARPCVLTMSGNPQLVCSELRDAVYCCTSSGAPNVPLAGSNSGCASDCGSPTCQEQQRLPCRTRTQPGRVVGEP